MTFFSWVFPVFLAVAAAVYYLIPGKHQWLVLLAASLVFYLWRSPLCGLYLLFTGAVTYGAGRLLGRLNDLPREQRSAAKGRKKLVLTLDLVLLFGLLFFVKYWKDTASLLGISGGLDLLLPMGISFYIFQSVGYAVDCYRGKYPPEKNPLKLLLFVSFFPQMVQGPISRFDQLGPQLTTPHSWDADSVKYGIQRMLWGYLKKLVIADRAGVIVAAVLGHPESYGGAVTAFGVLFYCIQLYCDFSGGIDITIGAAQLFGITVAENFRRPIFARSLAEYWRRWHITLGTWMRDYVFYPLSMSKPFARLGKAARKHIPGRAGKVVATALATFVVYLIIGIWHGADVKYIVFGLWNGLLMTLSVLLAGPFLTAREKLHADEKKGWFPVFQTLRTMLIVFAGRYLTASAGLSAALSGLWKTVRHPCLYQVADGTLMNLGLTAGDFIVVGVGVAVLLVLEWRQEQGVELRRALERKSVFVQFLCLFVPLMLLLFLGILRNSAVDAAFIYQQF